MKSFRYRNAIRSRHVPAVQLKRGNHGRRVVRFIVEKIKGTDQEKKERGDRGVLFTSGLIAGEGIMGIILAVFAVVGLDLSKVLRFSLPQIGSLVIFIVLLCYLYRVCMKKDK